MIHPVFHVSLLKHWNPVNLQEDQPISRDDVPEVDEPYYEIERILRWRKVKRKNKIIKQYLVLWRGYPVEDAMWIEADQFSYPGQLQEYLREDHPQEEKILVVRTPLIERGSSCDNSGISYISAYVPMSPRARTSVPDDWLVIEVSKSD